MSTTEKMREFSVKIENFSVEKTSPEVVNL